MKLVSIPQGTINTEKRQEGAGYRREFPFRKVQLIRSRCLTTKTEFKVSIPQGTINTSSVLDRVDE